jgi:hypothetical protein
MFTEQVTTIIEQAQFNDPSSCLKCDIASGKSGARMQHCCKTCISTLDIKKCITFPKHILA